MSATSAMMTRKNLVVARPNQAARVVLVRAAHNANAETSSRRQVRKDGLPLPSLERGGSRFARSVASSSSSSSRRALLALLSRRAPSDNARVLLTTISSPPQSRLSSRACFR